MEVLGNTLFIFALAAYFGSAGAYAVGFTLRHGRAAALAFWLMLAGAAAQFMLTSVHLVTAHRLPLGLADGGALGPWDHPFVSLGWLLAVAASISGLLRPTSRILGAFLAPVVVALLLGALLSGDPRDMGAFLPSALEGAWVPLHLAAMYASVSLFALAFGSGIVYLHQDRRLRNKILPSQGGLRLPPLGVLDSTNHHAFVGGLIGLSLGIGTGTFVALTGGGEGLDLRPKVVATLGLWMLYALGWQARNLLGWGGRKAAWVAIVGFVGLLASAVGVGHS